MGVLVLAGFPAASAPICVFNQSGQALVLVVDDLDTQRISQVADNGGQLCMKAESSAQKALVGVFADVDALEGCSRLTRPGQLETLLEFTEFDNCRWQKTNRVFE